MLQGSCGTSNFFSAESSFCGLCITRDKFFFTVRKQSQFWFFRFTMLTLEIGILLWNNDWRVLQNGFWRFCLGALLSPSPTPPVFSRWSTSLLNSAGSSPASSARSSFNHRQPYLGWRSQERLTNPRTPAERLAQGILPQLQAANKVCIILGSNHKISFSYHSGEYWKW